MQKSKQKFDGLILNEHEIMGVTLDQERALSIILIDSSLYLDMSFINRKELLSHLRHRLALLFRQVRTIGPIPW
jgi:hypothetical protein